jgi:hypothetical protein
MCCYVYILLHASVCNLGPTKKRQTNVSCLMSCTLQGTTTNGEYLLPFKTGAFLAGLPVQPVVLKYGKVCSAWL